jgi:hypothetical protein
VSRGRPAPGAPLLPVLADLAGGVPSKHVARVAADSVRWIAAGLKGETK